MLWLQMITILSLGVLLSHLMGFLIHVSHYFDTNISLSTSHLLHCMPLAKRIMMMILGHFWPKVFNQLFWFSVKSAFSNGKHILFTYFFQLKAWGFVKTHFLAYFFQSVPRGKLKLSPVGRERAALPLAMVLKLQYYPRQEGLELVFVRRKR